MTRIAAIIAAGGTGERFGAPAGKQLALVAGLPVLSWSLRALAASSCVDEIVVVAHPDRVAAYDEEAVMPLALPLPVRVVPGGDTRQDSVRAGLAAVASDVEIIIVHDGARPLAPSTLFGDAVRALIGDPELAAVVVGHPSIDTLKRVDGSRVLDSPDRSAYWAVQTPQVFRADALRRAHAAASANGFIGTDDAMLVEVDGGVVGVIHGPHGNIKVTHPADLDYAGWLLSRSGEGVDLA